MAFQKRKMNKIKEFALVFIGIVLMLFLIYGFASFKNITGHVVLSIEPNYQEGQILEGSLKISLNQGELIPANSKIIFQSGNQTIEYNLNELVSDEALIGNYYLDGTEISGEGEGYGMQGEKKIYPDVYFALNVKTEPISEEPNAKPSNSFEDNSPAETPVEGNAPVSDSQISEKNSSRNSQETNSAGAAAESPTENTEIPAIEQTEPISGTANEIPSETTNTQENSNPNENPIPTTSESAPITGNAVSNLFLGFSDLFSKITGNAALELGSVIEGKVSAENPFNYDFGSNSVSVEVAEGSVKTNFAELSESAVKLNIENGKLTVTTDYSEIERGFGREYFGNAGKTLVIDLSPLNFAPSEKNMRISITNNGEEILFLTTDFEEEILSNQTQAEINLTENNITETNFTANISGKILTEEERKILIDNFGNETVKITKAEKVGGGFAVRQEMGNYWIENFYDSSAGIELKVQIEEDRIIWLKDLINEFSRSENQSEEISDLIGEYQI